MQLTSDHSRNEGVGLTANIASRRCLPLFSSFSSKSAGVSGCVKNFTESKRHTDEASRKCYRHLVIASGLKLKRRQYPGLAFSARQYRHKSPKYMEESERLLKLF
jgi:hypothetical protein